MISFKNAVYSTLFFCLLLSSSCLEKSEENQNELAEQKLELMAVDRAFSAMSLKEGMKAAFVDYLDSNGVLLRPANLPIIGANAIDYLIQQNDATYTLTWNPVHAEVSASGELGYTYGEYAMQFKSENNPTFYDTVIYGTYTSVWKKQQDKKWKLMLHTANEGLGE